MKRLFFYYLRYPHDIRMKYCGCGWGCGCQNSCGYPRMRIRMRSSDTPLVYIYIYLNSNYFMPLCWAINDRSVINNEYFITKNILLVWLEDLLCVTLSASKSFNNFSVNWILLKIFTRDVKTEEAFHHNKK